MLAVEECGAHAVGVHGHPVLLEGADLRHVESPGREDPHVPQPFGVERVAHVPDEGRVHAGRRERAHLGKDRLIHHVLRGRQLDAPEPRVEPRADEGARHLERGARRVVLVVHRHHDLPLPARALGESHRRLRRAAAVRRDERVRHHRRRRRPTSAQLQRPLHRRQRPAHPRRVGVAGVNEPVVVPRREDGHGLGPRRLDQPPRVRADARPPRQHADAEQREVRDLAVRPLDRHRDVPRLHPVAVEERVDDQPAPVARPRLEQRHDLVHPAHPPAALGRHLHGDARRSPLRREDALRHRHRPVRLGGQLHEVRRDAEGRGVEALTSSGGHLEIL